MLRLGHGDPHETAKFVAESGIDADADARNLSDVGSPISYLLAKLDETGSLSHHYTDTGADYLFSRLDYYGSERLVASRFIATILAGKRTELAYWTKEAPAKRLTVHQGSGELVVGDPEEGATTVFALDPEVTPEVVLPPGRFYTFAAAHDTPKPFVVSGIYSQEVDWGELEQYVQPGQETLETPDGLVPVPEGFRARA